MGKGKKLFKRLLSSFLSLALVMTGVSFNGTSAQAAEDGLILYYDFVSQNDQAAQIPDASRNNNVAEIEAVSGGARGKYKIVDANIYGKEVKALDLVGGEDGAYLLLPEGIISKYDAVTISTWVKLSTDNGYQRIWDFGSGTEDYINLLSDGWNQGLEGYTVNINHAGSGEIGVSKGTDANGNPINIDKNRWVLTTVVMDGTKMSLYENGKLVGEKDTGITVKDLGETTQNFIAYSQWGDNPTTGQFAEFKIYSKALSADEIADMYYVTDKDIVESDQRELDLGDISSITDDMELPSRGASGSEITWASDNDAIAVGDKNEDGSYTATVTRPAQGAEAVNVKLTATLSYNGNTAEKDFTVTVVPEYSDQQKVAHDKEAVVSAVGDISTVIAKEISLPSKGEWGSDLTWAWEGSAGVIAIPEKAGEDGDYIVTVTRPAIGSEDASGKLVATVTSGAVKETVEIPVTVKAYRESIGIKSVEEVNVVTLAGHSPSLPNYVKATYTDGSMNKLKVRWPDAIEEEKYAQAGAEFEVEGQIVGEYDTVTAKVSVVDKEEVAKAVVSDSFDLSDISLDKIGEDGSILTQNRDRDLAYLKLLDNKRMLYNFYKTFGETEVIKDVEPLGGWDEPTGLLRGHSTGHYMSALALAYASTGDEEIKAKLDEMVSELHKLQQKSKGNAADFKISGSTMEDSLDTATWSTDPNEWGEGFVSAYSPDQFALLEVYAPYGSPGTGIWAPYYTLHKLLAGFLDAYTYTGNKEALETAKGLGKWAYARLSACSQEQLTRMWGMYIAGELGGMNESMAQLYIYAKEEGDPDADIFLKGAKLFDNTTFFDNLAKNVDDIQGRHANQHIPQIIGAMKLYEATVEAGKPEMYYYDIAQNFWQMVVSRYAYSIGGVGVGEAFSEDPYTQANNIRTDTNCETCAAYNMMKLTKMLNNYDPDNAEYMDYYERTLYNQILASQTPNVTDDMHNGTTYMLPIGPGVRRSYGGDYDSFTCCHGTGMENHVKYQEAAYAKTDDTLYVGLYLPSTVTWAEKGVKVVQETSFPSEDTKLTVSAADVSSASDDNGAEAPSAFNMKLRVPYWATNGFVVKVNGEEKATNPEISTYVELKDVKVGDVIEIHMPWTLHLDKTPDTIGESQAASIMYGPFVMAAKNSSTEWQRLVLPEHLEDVVKTGVNEENGFPILSVGGFDFAPMFAPEYATEAYHAYFKVLVTADDGSTWYEVKVTNNTPINGTISTNAKAEMIKEGDNLEITLSPNEGYIVKKLLVNGKEVTPTDNKYVIEDVKGNVEIAVTFRPPVLNEENLEYSADLSTDQWEPYYGEMTDIMTDWEPTSSISSGGKGWVNWWKAPGDDCYVQYTWDEAVTMDTFNVFWRVAYNGTDDDWMHVPGSVKVMYLDADGSTWKEANMHSEYKDIIKLDQYNTIKFDPVTTTAVRLAMTIANTEQAGCTGIYRWKVSNVGVTEADKKALNEAITAAKALKEADYTADSWKKFSDALTAAQAAADKADATQEEVDAAAKALTDAQAALEKATVTPTPVEADKKALNEAITAAKALKEADYTADSWKKFSDALTAAQAAADKADATQAEVDAAAKALTAAQAALEKATVTPTPVEADKKALNDAIAAAKALKEADYTADSWKKLSDALTAAQAAAAKADATQAEVDAAAKALTDAQAALVKAGSTDQPGANAAVKVSSVKFTAKTYKVLAGKKLDLSKKVKVAPNNAANKALKWAVSNTKYATVSAKGVVSAKAAGAGKTVTVTAAATDGSKKIASAKVKITDAVKKITLKAAKSVKAGKSVKVKATVKTIKKKNAKVTLKWTVSNKKYATVSKKGVVKTKKAGAGKTVKVTAAATDGSGKKATWKIKIKK